MRHFISVFVLILVFALWALPAYMMHLQPALDGKANGWGLLYLPIFGLTIGWLVVVYKHYFSRD